MYLTPSQNYNSNNQPSEKKGTIIQPKKAQVQGSMKASDENVLAKSTLDKGMSIE